METKKETNANNVYYCTVKDYVFQNLPDEVISFIENGNRKVSVDYKNHHFLIFDEEQIFRPEFSANDIMNIYSNHELELISDSRSLFLAVFHACKRIKKTLSYHAIFHLRFEVFDDHIAMDVIQIDE